jgi:hypothetical protein
MFPFEMMTLLIITMAHMNKYFFTSTKLPQNFHIFQLHLLCLKKIKFWFDPLNPLFHPQFRSPFFVLVGCFFVCVLGERFVRNSNAALHHSSSSSSTLSLALSLSSFAAAAANTKQNKWRRVWWSAGSCCADLPLLLGP